MPGRRALAHPAFALATLVRRCSDALSCVAAHRWSCLVPAAGALAYWIQQRLKQRLERPSHMVVRDQRAYLYRRRAERPTSEQWRVEGRLPPRAPHPAPARPCRPCRPAGRRPEVWRACHVCVRLGRASDLDRGAGETALAGRSPQPRCDDHQRATPLSYICPDRTPAAPRLHMIIAQKLELSPVASVSTDGSTATDGTPMVTNGSVPVAARKQQKAKERREVRAGKCAPAIPGGPSAPGFVVLLAWGCVCECKPSSRSRGDSHCLAKQPLRITDPSPAPGPLRLGFAPSGATVAASGVAIFSSRLPVFFALAASR